MSNIRAALLALVEGLTRPQKHIILLAADALIAPLALVVALAVLWGGARWPDGMAPLFGAVLAFGTAFAAAMRTHRVKLRAQGLETLVRMAAVAGLTGGALAVLCATVGPSITVPAVVLFTLMFFVLSVLARAAMLHLLLAILRHGTPRKRALIYGAGATGEQILAAMRAHGGLVPVCFVDDDPALHGLWVAGLRVLPPARIGALVADKDVDRVILAMPAAPPARLADIARRLEVLGLQVTAVPSFARHFGGQTLLGLLSADIPRRLLGRAPMEATMRPALATYQGRSVLVTGAGGSVGAELCRQIAALGPRRIVLFEIAEPALYAIDRDLRDLTRGTGTDIVPVLGSVCDARLARAVMRDHAVDVVLHAAAYKHVPLVEANPLAGLSTNVLGTRTLAEAAVAAGVGRFVLISSDKAVRPTNVMGASKRLAELVIDDMARRAPATVFSTVRFGNVLGSSGSVVPLFRDQIARGGPVTLTHEEVTRFFMTLTEAAQLVLLSASLARQGAARGGDIHVLDMGPRVRIRDMAVQMIAEAGLTLRDAANPHGDIEIVVTGLRPGEKLHEELLIGASPGSGFAPTSHPKIMRAAEAGQGPAPVARALRDLRAAIAAGDAAAARSVLAVHVEGLCLAGAIGHGGGHSGPIALPAAAASSGRRGWRGPASRAGDRSAATSTRRPTTLPAT